MSCRPPPQARVHPGQRRTFPHAWFMGRPGLRMAWARTMGPASWPAAQGHQQNSWALKSNTCLKISRLQDCIRGLSSPFLSLWHGPAPRLGGREGRIPRTSWPTWSLTALGPDRGRGQGGPERPERIASAGWLRSEGWEQAPNDSLRFFIRPCDTSSMPHLPSNKRTGCRTPQSVRISA